MQKRDIASNEGRDVREQGEVGHVRHIQIVGTQFVQENIERIDLNKPRVEMKGVGEEELVGVARAIPLELLDGEGIEAAGAQEIGP